MSTTFKLFKGSALQTITLFVNLLAVFLLFPFIVKTLGDKIYGLWVLASSLTGYYFLLDFGISQAVSRFIARALGKNRKEETKSVISNSIFMFSCIALFTIIFTIILAFFLKYFVPSDILLISRILLITVGLEFAFTLPLRTYGGVLKAHLDFDIFSLFDLITIILRSGLIFFFLSKGYGIIALAIINLLTSVIFYLANFFYVRKKYPEATFNAKLIKKKKIKELFKFSQYIFLTQIGDNLRYKIDSFVIAGFIGLASVTLYSIAVKIVDYYMQLMIALTSAVIPLFYRYEGAKDFDSIRQKFILGTRISTIFAFIIGANLIIFGKNFIQNWMGKDYINAYSILIILVIPYIFDLSQRMGMGVLQSLNKHYIYTIMNGVEGVINLILSIILVQKIGIIGVAIGTAIPLLIIKGFIQPYIICKHVDLKISKYLREISKIVIFLLAFFSLVYLLFYKITSMSYIFMGIAILTELSILSITLYAFILRHEEKKIIQDIFYKLKEKSPI